MGLPFLLPSPHCIVAHTLQSLGKPRHQQLGLRDATRVSKLSGSYRNFKHHLEKSIPKLI